MEGLVSNSGRIRELCIESDEIPYLDALLQEAGQLETLAIAVPESGANKEYLGSIDSWRVPQLRTLFARAFTGWQRGRFSTLRHLILDYPEWDDCALRGLYALLSSNPRIEDLVLIHNSSRDNREEPLKGLPPVNLPYLERIVANNTVNGDGHCTAAQIFEKILLPEEVHATVYEFRYKLLPEDYFAPLQKLYLHKSSHAVTTDGRTSYYLKGAVRVYVKHCVEAAQSRPLQVRELWLWSYSPVAGLPPLYSLAIKEWMHGLRVMAEVKKLVLLHDIKAWLQFITQKRLLPSLTELQLHSQEHEHEPAISRFLEERAQSNPIQVLRFVQDPEAGGKVEAFSHWKERSQFSNLARRVVFEDPSDGPLRMELPPICTTESTVHSYWPSWESTMYNYVAQDRKTVYVYS
ncbi:hypothetical protein BC835DRAFT_1400357 [Cytidiella melzeri]|nr:hypothetical protein BC835DRAFT_1400357 [Cytidiella melzeri]